MRKNFCCEDDRILEENVRGVQRRPKEIGRPSVPLVVGDEVCLSHGCGLKNPIGGTSGSFCRTAVGR